MDIQMQESLMQFSQWITLERLKSNNGRRNYCRNVMFIGWGTQSA